jgi:glycosyltransferase involved in cell wall biosynthesis
MHIAVVSLQFEETSTGGGGVHVENVCEQFLKLGHQVTLISIHTKMTLDKVTIKSRDEPFSIQYRDNLSVVRLLIDEGITQPYEGEKEIELNRIERFGYAVTIWLKKNYKKFDMIQLHGHHIIPGYMARELQVLGIPIVSVVHSLESSLISKKGESLGSFVATESIAKKLKKWEGMVIFADFIVLNSLMVRNDLEEILKEQKFNIKKIEQKIHFISSGCNEDFLMDDEEIIEKLACLPEVIQLVSFCRIDPSKGIEFAIQGVKALAEKSPQSFFYTIAGIPASDVYRHKIESEIKDTPKNLTIRLRFFDRISPLREKKEILDDKHIYVFSSLKEPFGMSLIEASARGNIIVSTDTYGSRFMMAGVEDLYFNWGRVTPFGIISNRTDNHHSNLGKNITEAILWTIDNWGECKQKILKFNKKIRQKWTWEGIAKKYLELFT